ncbi:aspartate/glutamate racemase family protein [Longirhabdus pacifica]|uniref:aspartate/glutamate racemase family protein n=1 Tax=Longirhabdus pacifica TaxID=2305227 RepID=UPI0010089254|nr:amino acid racemase [Longirhabdus pacifica]
MYSGKTIGIVGGLGPFAGIDMVKQIFYHTKANTDQDHIPVILISAPQQIEPRVTFVLGESSKNPAHSIVTVIQKLERAGADIIGIPCNTAHAPMIMNIVKQELKKRKSNIVLINMIDEIFHTIKKKHPNTTNVGILTTSAMYETHIYKNIIQSHGYNAIIPPADMQRHLVNQAIYDKEYGIKSQSHPVSLQARANLLESMQYLIEEKADVIILGCTELPLAIHEQVIDQVPIIHSTMVLATALIKKASPERLKDGMS